MNEKGPEDVVHTLVGTRGEKKMLQKLIDWLLLASLAKMLPVSAGTSAEVSNWQICFRLEITDWSSCI